MSPEEAKSLTENHLSISRAVAREFAKNDEGKYNDYLSVAYEGLLVAARSFDLSKCRNGVDDFGPYAVQRVRWYLINHLKKENSQLLCNASSLDYSDSDDSDGTFGQSIVDKRQDNPSEVVEMLDLAGSGRIKMSQMVVKADKQTGQWVAALKAACFNAVTTHDMTDIMKVVVKKAKKGDIQATKLLLDYLCGGKAGGINQTVIVNQGMQVNE